MIEAVPHNVNQQSRDGTALRSGWRGLAASVFCVALIWLVVLPAVGRSDALKTAIEEQAERGIDASAMFYTELEVMDDVLARTKKFHRENPDALWQPGS